MADTVEFSVLKVVVDSLSSPAVQKIGEAWDLKDDIEELQRSLMTEAEAVVEEEEDVNGGGGMRFQLRTAAYETEDLINNLTVIAANLIGSGNQRSGRYDLHLDDLDGVAS